MAARRVARGAKRSRNPSCEPCDPRRLKASPPAIFNHDTLDAVTVSPDSVLIVGAGSLGTLYGACLSRAGCDVQLLARPAHAAAIADAGCVVVEDHGTEWRAALLATPEPGEVRPASIVLLVTQTQDSESALASIGHVRDDVAVAVSLQNGGGTERAWRSGADRSAWWAGRAWWEPRSSALGASRTRVPG